MTTKLLRLAFAGAFLTTTTLLQAAIAPAENLLPADTIAFFTVPDCNALRAASKVSPQLMFWNDPAMKPFHDKFMGKFTEKFIAPLEKNLGLKAEDFADLLQGQFTFAATVNGSNGHDDIPPGLVVLLDVKDKSLQLKTNLAVLTKKMTDSGRTLRTEKIRGLSFSVVTLSTNDLSELFGQKTPVSEIGKEQKPQQPVDIYFTQYESLLIAANSQKLADAIAAHLTGGSVPALADEANFAADKLSQFRTPATYYGWFNGKVFFNLLAQIPDASDSDSDAMMPKMSVSKVLGATGLGNIRSASFAMREGRDGTVADAHISIPADDRGGILKIISLPAKDASAPGLRPRRCDQVHPHPSGWQAGLGRPAKNVRRHLATGACRHQLGRGHRNSMAQQKDPSFDLRKNLFGNLGDDIVTYAKAPIGDSLTAMANPPDIILVSTPNADQMIQAVKVWVR